MGRVWLGSHRLGSLWAVPAPRPAAGPALHRFVVWGGLHGTLLLSRRLLLVWRGGLLILRHERRVGTWQAAEDGEAWATRRTSRSPRRRGTLAPELAGEVLAAGKLYANNATEAEISWPPIPLGRQPVVCSASGLKAGSLSRPV